jgi:HEAT repeat protein
MLRWLKMRHLFRRLRSKRDEVRHAAAKGLVDIKDGQAAGAPIKTLGDGGDSAHHAAVSSLATTHDARLVELLGDSDTDVRLRAVYALAERKEWRSFKPIINALHDDDSRVRLAAVHALAARGNRRAVAPLIKVLGDSKVAVRLRAVNALAGRKEWQRVEPLIDALGDDDVRVRKAAVYALDKAEDDRVVEALIKALGNTDLNVCIGAVTVMARREAYVKHDTRVVEALLKLIGAGDGDLHLGALSLRGRVPTENEELRYAAACALEEIRDPRVGDSHVQDLIQEIKLHYKGTSRSHDISQDIQGSSPDQRGMSAASCPVTQPPPRLKFDLG